MAQTYVFIVLIAVGTIIAIQGIRLLRKGGRTSILPVERTIMSVFGGNNMDIQLRVLGRIRVVVGGFLIVIGIWAMVG